MKHSKGLGEIIRFGIVGVIATGIQYGIYYLLLGQPSFLLLKLALITL